MSRRWREVAGYVWEREWEPIVIILGLGATLLAAPLSFPLLFLNACMFTLLGYKLYRTAGQADRLLREKHVPIVVLVGRGDEVAESMWQDIRRVMERWDFDVERYRHDFDVEREDLLIHHEEPLPTDSGPWLKLSRDFRHKIERIGGRLPGRRIFHIFINGPVSIAVGLGASIGTMHEIVVHQWFPGTTQAPYYPVVDFYSLSETNPKGMHFLEDTVTGEFHYVRGEGAASDTKDLFMSVWTARDDPRADVNRMADEAEAAGHPAGTFHVVQQEPRSLETTDDWILCTREILTLLYQQITRNRPERIHLFLSAPVALAFTLGMGIEHFMPVTIYNWWGQERQYYPVLPLGRLARTSER